MLWFERQRANFFVIFQEKKQRVTVFFFCHINRQRVRMELNGDVIYTTRGPFATIN